MNSDSLLSIRSGTDLKAMYRGDWAPEYGAVERASFILMDENGGMGAYTLGPGGGLGGIGGGPESPRTSVSFSKDSWQISLFIRAGNRFLTSVFPPRLFDWEKSFNDRIVHHFFSHPPAKPWNPHPRDDELEEYSRHGNILVLHWWQQGNTLAPVGEWAAGRTL